MTALHSGNEVFRDRGVKMVGILNVPAAPEGRKVPGVLFLHGFPGAEKNEDIQRRLLRKGVASFSPHFRGAWGSDGDYSFSGQLSEARAALRFLESLDFIDRRRLAVFGFSMGGRTAINLGSRVGDLKAVAAVAPVGGPELVGPDTRERIAHLCRPLRVESVDSLYRDFIGSVRRLDPVRHVTRLRCPLLLVHGREDEIVPFSSSERVFAAAREPKTFVRVPGARHDFLDRREWLSRVVSDWLLLRLRA